MKKIRLLYKKICFTVLGLANRRLRQWLCTAGLCDIYCRINLHTQHTHAHTHIRTHTIQCIIDCTIVLVNICIYIEQYRQYAYIADFQLNIYFTYWEYIFNISKMWQKTVVCGGGGGGERLNGHSQAGGHRRAGDRSDGQAQARARAQVGERTVGRAGGQSVNRAWHSQAGRQAIRSHRQILLDVARNTHIYANIYVYILLKVAFMIE